VSCSAPLPHWHGSSRDRQLELEGASLPPASQSIALTCHLHCVTLLPPACPVALDTTTPPAMGRHYAEALPSAELHLLEGEGHISLPLRRGRDILASALTC